MDLKEMVERWAYEPYITCETSKCGQRLREQIKSEVSRDFLIRYLDEVNAQNIIEIEEEIRRRYIETPLYKRVKSLMDQEQDLKQIAEDLSKEGIEI